MMRFTEEETNKMRQLYRAGFGTEIIAKAFDTDRSVVHYHVKDIDEHGRLKLAEWVKSIIPHMPQSGPPFPRGYSLTWEEQEKLEKYK